MSGQKTRIFTLLAAHNPPPTCDMSAQSNHTPPSNFVTAGGQGVLPVQPLASAPQEPRKRKLVPLRDAGHFLTAETVLVRF